MAEGFGSRGLSSRWSRFIASAAVGWLVVAPQAGLEQRHVSPVAVVGLPDRLVWHGACEHGEFHVDNSADDADRVAEPPAGHVDVA